jgi:acyl-CoA synthetase (AMP-forming)/AMP-acid ligase II
MCTPDIAPNVDSIIPSLSNDIRSFALEYGSFPNIPSTSAIPLIRHTDLPVPNANFQRPKVEPYDIANLIYTSGTTGNPKACAIQQGFLQLIAAQGHPTRNNPPRTLSCLPLFHGTCYFTGLCQSAGAGGCFILARKFSARGFWKDCHLSRATKILYVGELCRYLLATPEGEYDRKHQVECASGNGMRPEVWDKFKARFNIPRIVEYYRSTEVHFSL